MKFKTYITEMITTSKWDELKNVLNKDCKPFIKNLKGIKNLLYRGVKMPPIFYTQKTTRLNRKPRLLSIELHNKLGKDTIKRFGWNIRETGIFTSNNIINVKRWGNPSIVFPIGKFKYVWLKDVKNLYAIYDLWDEYEDLPHMQQELWDNNIKDILDQYNTTNINKYLSMKSFSKSECIIQCEKYYSINIEWNETLIAYYTSDKYK
jgi:hypothetical protein